jgi:hypothetical protein
LETAGGSFGFRCATCGEYHSGMPSFGWEWPITYLLVPREERERRVELGPDSCVIDGSEFYVRGCLDIPVHHYDEPFSWGAWVSLSKESFVRFEALRDDVRREPGDRFAGWLSSVIPGYPDMSWMKAALHIRPWPLRPFIELEPTDHPLAVEQREGITRERVHEVAERVLHADGSGR